MKSFGRNILAGKYFGRNILVGIYFSGNILTGYFLVGNLLVALCSAQFLHLLPKVLILIRQSS
jgi:hypothetical protein